MSGSRMTEASREELEQRVNAGNDALGKALAALVESLSQYGFEGSVELNKV